MPSSQPAAWFFTAVEQQMQEVCAAQGYTDLSRYHHRGGQLMAAADAMANRKGDGTGSAA